MAGTVISSAAVNSNFADLAVAMTGSFARDGQSSFTGQFKLPDGGLTAPALSFNNETNTGFIRSGAGQISAVIQGTQIATFSTTGINSNFSGTTFSGTTFTGGTFSGTFSGNVVNSIAGNTGVFTLGTGLTNSVNDIRVSLSTVTNSLGADVSLTTSYTDGPSVAQGTSGTWLATGTITFADSAAASVNINFKLWDGATVIASGAITTQNANANARSTITLSGVLASPAGNIRISAISSAVSGSKMLFNQSALSKDSTLTVVRIV